MSCGVKIKGNTLHFRHLTLLLIFIFFILFVRPDSVQVFLTCFFLHDPHILVYRITRHVDIIRRWQEKSPKNHGSVMWFLTRDRQETGRRRRRIDLESEENDEDQEEGNQSNTRLMRWLLLLCSFLFSFSCGWRWWSWWERETRRIHGESKDQCFIMLMNRSQNKKRQKTLFPPLFLTLFSHRVNFCLQKQSKENTGTKDRH